MSHILRRFGKLKIVVIIILLLSATVVYAAHRDYISTATNSKVTLNASTFTKLVDANSKRSYLIIGNPSGNDVFVNLRAAGSGVDETGIYLKSGGNIWIMPCSAIYTGEICAIAVEGTPSVTICEY